MRKAFISSVSPSIIAARLEHMERRGNIRTLAALYTNIIYSDYKNRATKITDTMREFFNPQTGEARMAECAKMMHERANDHLRTYTARIFIYEHIDVGPEKRFDAEDRRREAFQLREELTALCKALNIPLDRRIDAMPPVAHTSYWPS